MTSARASSVLRTCAIVFVVLGVVLFVASRRVGQGETELVAEAERTVIRNDLDQERGQE